MTMFRRCFTSLSQGREGDREGLGELQHIHHLQKRLTLHIIKYNKVFSDNPTVSDSLSPGLLLTERTTRFQR